LPFGLYEGRGHVCGWYASNVLVLDGRFSRRTACKSRQPFEPPSHYTSAGCSRASAAGARRARSRQDWLDIEKDGPHIPANRGQPNRASSPRARRKHVAASPTLVQCGLSPEGIAKFPRTAFHEGTFSRHRTARADRRPAFSELRVMCSEAPPPFPHRHF
jgi:hypothetical protein